MSISKWYRENPDKIENSKTPLGCICRYIKKSPVLFKKNFSGFCFIFYGESQLVKSSDTESFTKYKYL